MQNVYDNTIFNLDVICNTQRATILTTHSIYNKRRAYDKYLQIFSRSPSGFETYTSRVILLDLKWDLSTH
jgi:hypothetical protein